MSARVVVSLDSAIVAEVELSKPVTVVGRHPDCDIVIDHPLISGRHMVFWILNRTVYVEDLASTNGTKVNGITVVNHVVHHLDMIKLGKHKLHFFEDALPAKGVSDLESAVPPGTMMAAHVPETAPKAAPRRGGDDLSRTMALQRDPAIRRETGQEVVRTDEPPVGGVLALRVREGQRAGDLIGLERGNTMIGAAGDETALVVRRGQSLFLTRLSGSRAPRLNRRDLEPGAHPISAGDVIEVGGSVFELIVVP